MSGSNQMSRHITALLRHNGPDVGLPMDRHGWVPVDALIACVNTIPRYNLTRQALEDIVRADNKGRFRFDAAGERIKACQGHTIPWVEPELTVQTPPDLLYHGTTQEAWAAIRESGSILRMERHAVHMQAEIDKAWQSALRWRKPAVVLKIDAARMHADGYEFGVSDNDVWCAERVPVEYVIEAIGLEQK